MPATATASCETSGGFALDLSQLEPLAKAAGIGGIAIGAVILILNAIVNQTQTLPARERAPTLRFLATIAFGVGALGIGAWLAAATSGGQRAFTRGNESPAIIGGGNVTLGPATPPRSSAPAPQGGIAPNATAETGGERSPAIISGGDVTISTPDSSPKPPRKK
jgi:hypothetical protein